MTNKITSLLLHLQHLPIVIAMLSKTRFKLKGLIFFGGRFIYHDSHDNTKYNRICSEQMDITMRRFAIKMGTIFVSFLFALIGPLHAYFVRGIKTTTTEIHIQFCEPNSNAEFMGNILFQSVIAVYGLLMYVGIEIMFSIFENVVTIAPRLVEKDLAETIQLYEEKSLSEAELNWEIKGIVTTAQDADG